MTESEYATVGELLRVLEAELDALLSNLRQKPSVPMKMTKTQLTSLHSASISPEQEAELFVEALLDPDFLTGAMTYLQRLQEKKQG